MSQQHRHDGYEGAPPTLGARSAQTPGKRTRTESLRPRSTPTSSEEIAIPEGEEIVVERFAPPAEINEGRLPDDAVLADVSPRSLRSVILLYLDDLDLRGAGGEIARKALVDFTLPANVRGLLMNGVFQLPLIWQTDDASYVGALRTEAFIDSWIFETAEDGVAVGSESENESEIEASAGASNTMRAHLGSDEDVGGIEGEDETSRETRARSGASTRHVTEAAESVRFKLRVRYQGALSLTKTPIDALSKIAGAALPMPIYRSFSFFDSATVRFPRARCLPITRSA